MNKLEEGYTRIQYASRILGYAQGIKDMADIMKRQGEELVREHEREQQKELFNETETQRD